MKSAHPYLSQFILFLAGVSCLFFSTTANLFASAEDQIAQAEAASKEWVAKIDARKYDESYTFACDAMHDKVPQDRWVQVLKALRTPWGPVVSRKQISHIYKPNGVPGLEGECMVITYDTSFKQLDTAMEVIVLKWEGGKWRGAGYNAGPKPSTDEEVTPPPTPSATETRTEPHVKPQPK
jgi:hypothetical protein